MGKRTLDEAICCLNLNKVEDAEIRRKHHRFGNYGEEQLFLFGAKMPFFLQQESDAGSVHFTVAFDVIDGDLLFLIELSSLIATAATVNHKYFTLVLYINGKYTRLQVGKVGGHFDLSFQSTIVVLKNEQYSRRSTRSDNREYYSWRKELRNGQ